MSGLSTADGTGQCANRCTAYEIGAIIEAMIDPAQRGVPLLLAGAWPQTRVHWRVLPSP
jgi:hypothetical protein